MNIGDIDLWSPSGANPFSGSEQRKVVITAKAMGDTWCQMHSSVINNIRRKTNQSCNQRVF